MEIPEYAAVDLPDNANHIGTLSPKLASGVYFREPISTGVSYLSSSVEVFKTELPTGIRFDAVIDHPPIDGNGLRRVLQTVAPAPNFNNDIKGVIDDWNVVDQANDPDRERYDGGRSQRLVADHERLGSAWTDFMASRPAFLEAFEDVHVPRFGLPADSVFTMANLVRQSDNLNALIKLSSGSLETMVDLLEEAGQEEAHTLVMDALHKEVNKHRHPNRVITKDDKVLARYKGWGESRRRDFLAKLLCKVVPAVQTEVISLTRNSSFETFTTEDGEEFSCPTLGLTKSLAQVYAEREVRRSGNYEATVMNIERQNDAFTHTVVLPNSVKPIHPPATLSPAIAWERTTEDKRQFVMIHSKQEGVDTTPTHYHDSTLGVLAVAYVSPGVRDSWPRSVRIPGGEAMTIGIAQVPVLAHMRQGQLLKSAFIQAAEGLARQ